MCHCPRTQPPVAGKYPGSCTLLSAVKAHTLSCLNTLYEEVAMEVQMSSNECTSWIFHCSHTQAHVAVKHRPRCTLLYTSSLRCTARNVSRPAPCVGRLKLSVSWRRYHVQVRSHMELQIVLAMHSPLFASHVESDLPRQ